MTGRFCRLLVRRSWWLVVPALFLVSGYAATVDAEEARRLAILVAAPWDGELAMHNDVVALLRVLRQRGFSPADVLLLEDRLTRRPLLAFLEDADRRIAAWPSGEVWLFVSGHGAFTGTRPSEARPGLLLSGEVPPSKDHHVGWDEIFATLQAPPGVRVTLLPDT